MPTYIQKSTTSDLTPSLPNTASFINEMSTGTGTDTFVTVSGMTGVTESAMFITPSSVPNNDAWEDGGTYTVEIEVDTTSSDITVDARIVKLSSTGTIIEGGSFTGSPLTLSGSGSLSPIAPTWSGSEACGNRLAIELTIVYSPAHGSATADIGLGTVANEVITANLTEDSAGCTASAVAIPLIINSSAMI